MIDSRPRRHRMKLNGNVWLQLCTVYRRQYTTVYKLVYYTYQFFFKQFYSKSVLHLGLPSSIGVSLL
jgi:hypothetical protein